MYVVFYYIRYGVALWVGGPIILKRLTTGVEERQAQGST
jgi:hypothetical protein